MKDFNNNEIKIGDTVFFNHEPEVVIGKVSQFESKKTFLVKFSDVIKFSKNIDKYSKYSEGSGYIVKCSECIIIN